jgi:hypothetical protein
MATHTTVCQICGAKNETSTAYDDFDCRCCGQAYVYEEDIRIALSPEQKKILLDDWLKTLDEKKENAP